MSKQTYTLLLDTNIWLDYYLGDRPQSDAAKDLIMYAEEKSLTLAYASTSLKDVFYILQREFKESFRHEGRAMNSAQVLSCCKAAWECICHMMEIAVAAPVGEAQIWLASHYEDLHADFEDDLILATLETSKAHFLVTGDETLQKKAPTGAFDATTMLTFLHTREE